MAYIGRQQSSGAFAKLDDVSSQFNNSKTVFNLTIGNEAFFPGNPYTMLVSLGGVIQEPLTSFTIASLDSVNLLKSVDLPTFGLPTIATIFDIYSFFNIRIS